MNGRIGMEETQEVTLAFVKQGHNFKSCDLQDCSGGRPDLHHKGDVFQLLESELPYLDFLGLHPVCKVLANSGVKHLARTKPTPGFEWSEVFQIYINPIRYAEVVEAAKIFRKCLDLVKAVGKGYVENPILHKYAHQLIGVRPTQIIQPWQFGHTTSKATCLWIVGLPKLTATQVIPKGLRTDEIHKCPPGPERAKIRSKTFPGIANAFAIQWGNCASAEIFNKATGT